MKQFLTKNIQYFFLVLLLSITSCQNDEVIQIEPEQTTQTILDFEAKNVSGYKLFQESKELNKHISSTFLKDDIQGKNLNSAAYGFAIDTTNVQVISGDTFDSYTFIVKRETPVPNTLENYVYTVFNDGGYTQMLVNYSYTFVNGEIEYNINSGTAQYIVDDNLVLGKSDSPCGSTSEEIISWEGICIPVLCGDVGNHLPGQACRNGEYIAHWECSGAWVVTGCVQGSSSSSSGTDPTNDTSGGGGNTTGGNTDPTSYPPSTPIIPKTYNLLDVDGITLQMNEWLNDNLEIKAELQNFLKDHNDPITQAIIFELIELLREELNANLDVLKFIVKAYQDDKYQNDIDTSFITTVRPYLELDLSDYPNVDPAELHQELVDHFMLKCAVLRYNNPDWSNLRVFYVATKDIVHLQLDVIGLIPVVGEIADLTNGILYTIEGDGVNASLSYASAIPFVGWVTAGTKMGIRIVNVAADITTKVKLVWKIGSDGIIQFGRRSQLRKVLNIPVGDPRQAHHIIPWAKGGHEAVQQAAKSGNAFHLNEALNGIATAAWRNQPNHNLYNQRVADKLDAIMDLNPNVDEAYQMVNELVETIRNAIVNNPNSHFNDLIF